MRFLKTFIILFLVSAVGVGIYQQLNEEAVPGKAKRLPCMAQVTSFERSYGIQDIKHAQEMIIAGNYTIASFVDKATYMDSTLFDSVDMHKMDQIASDVVKSFVKDQTKKSSNDVKIEYTVFENDRDDPKKKSKNCKLYRGYVVTKIKNNNNKVVYQNQIDFLDPQGKDVAQTIECGLKAFMTYK
ncbi:MAG: hypothetical protein IE909_13510 [Campylobacterales bacterium]|nr:hypothetical protein [Campylobacterales bacterium]